MTYVGKKPADIIATAVDTTTGTFSGDLTIDTNTLYVDSANNRVGVGTVSPAHALDVNGSLSSNGNENVMRIAAADSTQAGGININSVYGATASSRVTTIFSIDGQGQDAPLAFGNGTTEAMRIDSSGTVGIGIVPETFNGVDGAVQVGTRQTLTSFSNDVGIGYNHYYNSGWKYTNADVARRFSSTSSIPFIWQYAASGSADAAITWSEAMRIDSSGNLLVGHTSQYSPIGDGGSGVTLGANGQIFSGCDFTNLYLNAEDSNNEHIRFRKDGADVGSIGTTGGDIYIGTGDTGLFFADADNQIRPFNTSTVNSIDDAIDIGRSATRFKDLYLSGGVYLGGTGSANKLDDYETGNVTMSLSPDTSGTITLNSTYDNLAYTKVGRMVTLTGAIVIDGISSPTGTYVRVLGLPFTVGVFDGLGERSGFSVTYFDQSINDYIVEPAFLTGSVTEFRIYRPPNTWAANDAFYVNFSYFTA
jgi:hypothetical protein